MLPSNYPEKIRFGAEVEQWVIASLIAMGYDARPIAQWTAHGDVMVQMIAPVLVEVKAARPTMRKVRPGYYRPRWQFDVARLIAPDHIVVLVVQDENGVRWPYICPSWAFFGRRGVQITSHPRRYRGMFREYLLQWQMIDQVAVRLVVNDEQYLPLLIMPQEVVA